MMHTLKKWIFFMLLLSHSLNAEILEVSSLNEIEQYLSPSLTRTDWVLFDIDYTLTHPDHPALQMASIKQNKYRFMGELAKFSKQDQLAVPVIMVTHIPNTLTEPYAATLIATLQQKGATVFGFTAADTADVLDIGSFPEWRSKELNRLGIDFATGLLQSALPSTQVEFPQFAPHRGSYPLYRDGILYSNVIISKGDVLSAFLEQVHELPTRVVFVEDTLENLHSVEAVLKERNIPFLGIHYRAEGEIDGLPISSEEWDELWRGIRERVEKGRL